MTRLTSSRRRRSGPAPPAKLTDRLGTAARTRAIQEAAMANSLDVFSDHGGQFPWESRVLDVGGGTRQAYVDEGPRESRLTFLCAHGNPTWGFLYRKFIEALSPT